MDDMDTVPKEYHEMELQNKVTKISKFYKFKAHKLKAPSVHVVIVYDMTSMSYIRIELDGSDFTAMSASRLLLQLDESSLSAGEAATRLESSLGVKNVLTIDRSFESFQSHFFISFQGDVDIDLFDRVLDAATKLELTVCPDLLMTGLSPSTMSVKPLSWPRRSPFGVNVSHEYEDFQSGVPVRVGVIDSGFRSHPRLDGKIANGGQVDPDCATSHGFHVLSIIGAAPAGNCPMKGITQNAAFYAYSLSGSEEKDFDLVLENIEGLDADVQKKLWACLKLIPGKEHVSEFITFLDKALKDKVQLMNISLEWIHKFVAKYFKCLCQILASVLLLMKEKGCVFVVAAGNSPKNLDQLVADIEAADGDKRLESDVFSSLAVRQDLRDAIVVVTSCDMFGQFSKGCAFGQECVSIAAPGEKVLVLDPKDGYRYETGTSFAAPHVTAALVLLMSAFPGVPMPALVSRLLNTADQSPSLIGKCRSGGRLNIGRALTRDLIGEFGVLKFKEACLPPPGFEGNILVDLNEILQKHAKAEKLLRCEVSMEFEKAFLGFTEFSADVAATDIVSYYESNRNLLHAAAKSHWEKAFNLLQEVIRINGDVLRFLEEKNNDSFFNDSEKRQLKKWCEQLAAARAMQDDKLAAFAEERDREQGSRCTAFLRAWGNHLAADGNSDSVSRGFVVAIHVIIICL